MSATDREYPGVPDFLVIGAMKSGTTTLYEDIRRHPDVYLLEKESAVLAGTRENEYPQQDPAKAYAERMSTIRSATMVGEVATTYAMAPHFPGVVQLAHDVLPSTTRIIYIVREPLARIISHHHHDVSSGRIQVDVDEAVRTDARFIDYTRYAAQIKPWIEAFGQKNVLLLKFEDYISDRAAGLARAVEFLGLAPTPTLSSADYKIHNVSDGKPVARGGWRKLVNNPFYRQLVRPLVPEASRRRLMGTLLPKAQGRPSPPRPETVMFIRERLAKDQTIFSRIVGSAWWPEARPHSDDQEPLQGQTDACP